MVRILVQPALHMSCNRFAILSQVRRSRPTLDRGCAYQLPAAYTHVVARIGDTPSTRADSPKLLPTPRVWQPRWVGRKGPAVAVSPRFSEPGTQWHVSPSASQFSGPLNGGACVPRPVGTRPRPRSECVRRRAGRGPLCRPTAASESALRSDTP